MYQITHQLLNIPSSAFFTLSSYTSTRGHNLKFLKPYSRCVPVNYFSVRSISDWNSLPDYIVNATPLDHFKNLLDKHWTNQLFI